MSNLKIHKELAGETCPVCGTTIDKSYAGYDVLLTESVQEADRVCSEPTDFGGVRVYIHGDRESAQDVREEINSVVGISQESEYPGWFNKEELQGIMEYICDHVEGER